MFEQVACPRSHVGAGVTPWAARPVNVTVAVVASAWPGDSASVGTGWQIAQPTGCPSACVAATWEVCVPIRTASAALPQVARGGAPVVPSVPPWHSVQSVFQVAP